MSYASKRKKSIKIYYKNKLLHKCTHCGKPLISNHKYYECEKCLENHNNLSNQNYKRKKELGEILKHDTKLSKEVDELYNKIMTDRKEVVI